MKQLLVIFCIFIATSSSVFGYERDKLYKLTVLHTNDHHGAFWKNSNGEYGMAARATLIKKIREEVKKNGGHVLLFSGGDINTGTPESEVADAKPDFLGMSYMGYTAMAVGNHEFDKPFKVLLKQKEKWSNFPFLSANIINKISKKPFFDPYLIKKIYGLKVSVIGLTTDQADQQSIRFPTDMLKLISPIDAAKNIVPVLRKKSDIVIAVTHMGHYPDGDHGSRSPGDVTLAREVDGIDLIVGGHSSKKLDKIDIQNGTSIVQAGLQGKHLGRVDIEFKNGNFKVVNYELIPVNLKDDEGNFIDKKIPENRKLKNILRPYKKEALALTSEKVGTLSGDLEGDRNIIRKQQTNLGQLVTYLMANKTDSDIALTDSGVIRTGINEGHVTFGDILKVHPVAFSLKYATVKLTGKELWNYLQQVSVKTSGAYPQLYGIKVKLKSDQLDKVLIKLKNEKDFKEIDEKKLYKLAITDFIASGGDGYPKLVDHPSYSVTNFVDAEVMKEFFKKNKVLEANEFIPSNDILVKVK